ncbi:hypothetical protein IC235_10250 [Hymenobacter sp. BT664]|uniref:DUF5723 domain-containing protein n=1 Tax=Hymenobacter montanus TaxID=2771359 RepID=A0A927BDT7_9BACT|nr:DUF5723 family protein [Hymenobacter montanus]MBD2768273.1 hypothetical protein [Hymenobacter montanus]
MKAPLHHLLFAVLLALPAGVRAQNELSNFTATGRGGVINSFAQDYQVIGINPANLGRPSESVVSFTVLEGGAGLASRTLSKTLLKHLLYDGSQAIGPAERAELVKGLEGDNALKVNADVTTLGFALNLPNNLGGLAFSNRQRVGVHLALNRNAADVIINGKYAASVQPYYPTTVIGTQTLPPPLLSNFLDGTVIQLAWTSEYNVAYGVRVLDKPSFKLSVGAGYRYIQGVGIADLRVEGGKLSAYSALSPIFDINYGSLASSPQFNAKTRSGWLDPVGSGHGYDLGLSAEVGKMVQVGASVTDMGSMTWTGNVISASDQVLQPTTGNGVQTYDVIKEIAKQLDSNADNFFTYAAEQKRVAALPAKLRLGAGVRLNTLFEFGLDFTAPLNKVAGNLTSSFVGLGVDYRPVSWVRLSSGLSGGAGYGTSLPLGFTFITPLWEAGVSSRDVTGYFSEKAPYYSVALGFLRIKFAANK